MKVEKIRIMLLNDTLQDFRVRLHTLHSEPTTLKLEPRKIKTVFMETDTVMVKIWDGNVILIQDRGN